jgi:hypothetical protein
MVKEEARDEEPLVGGHVIPREGLRDKTLDYLGLLAWERDQLATARNEAELPY